MSLASFIKKQFIDILQWNEDEDGVLAWRYPMEDFEIQYGASLTVRESQMALFVNEGKVADVFGPGMYKLTTQTLPVLTYLKNWDKLFESPFKSDVYFFSTRKQLARKWGTPQPVTIRDTDFGMVRLRAFGIYSYAINDPKKFFTEISGTRETYTRDEVEEQTRGLITAAIPTALGSAGLPFLDMAANQTIMGEKMRDGVATMLSNYGLALDEFAISSVSLPDELQQAIDKRISMGMMGDLGKYTQYQVAESIPLAAKNEGGLAGIGASLSAGMVMGQSMSQAMGQILPGIPPAQTGALAAGAAVGTGAATATGASAITIPPAEDAEAQLGKLKALLDKGLISQTDYDSAKAAVLAKLIG